MQRTSVAAVLGVICIGLLLAPDCKAQQARSALVIGNATYTSLPVISGCARSAHAVSAALRALRFNVTEREDESSGGIDAGISAFSQSLGDGRGAAVVYVCGYGTGFNNRPFLLPTTANILRPSDVLTQGILAKSLLDTVTRGAMTAVVAFDVVPMPGGSGQVGLDMLAGLPLPAGVGMIAVADAQRGDGPTPLATALIAGLAGPEVQSGDLLAGVQAQLAARKVAVAAVHVPEQMGYLSGAPEPVRPVAAAAAPVAAAPPVDQGTPVSLPDEGQMTEADRRRVQDALRRLGYYDRSVDGVFGPETRAAIRRYQHEIGSEMSGRLTAAEATRLVRAH